MTVPLYLAGESISSETSNGYLNDADVSLLAWQAFEEEPDSPPPSDLNSDHQRSLLLSHTEALAGKSTTVAGNGGEMHQQYSRTDHRDEQIVWVHPDVFGIHTPDP